MRFKFLALSLFFTLLISSLAFATTQVYAPAVDSKGVGVLTPVIVTVTTGTGRIRTDIQGSLIATETEESIRDAALAASRTSRLDLEQLDVNVDIDSEAQLIDGPSGGVAFAVAIYNEMRHLADPEAPNIRTDMAITGAIYQDGRTEKVGGVEEKIIAAKDNGIKLMLIATGQSAADAIDYVVYASEISNGELQVVEVATLEQALDYVYTANNSKVDAPQNAITPLVLSTFQASEKTTHLKQIALEEIENVERELTKLNAKLNRNGNNDAQVKAVIRSVNETVKNAKEAVEKGYYYTGANAAFLAKINLQTANTENITPVQFQEMIDQLDNEVKAFNKTMKLTSDNFEEAGAAQLRYWWAHTRLQEAKAEFKNTNVVSISLLKDYFNARAWFDASKKLMEHAKSIKSGSDVNEFNTREYALDLLDQSAQIANTSSDTEVQWHFKTAKVAISNADYVAAALDLQFVTSAQRLRDLILNKTPEQVVQEAEKISNSNIYSGNNGSTWAELYYANALYSLQEANRSNEISSLASAIRLSELAAGFQDAKQVLKTEFVTPRQTKNHTANITNPLPNQPEPRVSATITTTLPENASLLQLIAIIVIAVGLVILIGALASKLKFTRKSTSTTELLDKLDEALVQGRISEATYNRLRSKYKDLQKARKAETSREKLRKRK